MTGREAPLVSPTRGTWRAQAWAGFLPESLSPYPSTVCTHHVDVAPRGRAPTVSPVGQTPIYDQVRGERINADVPDSGVDPQRVEDHGRHRLRPDTSVPAAVFGPPGLGDDLAPNRHRRGGQTLRVGQQLTGNGRPRCGDREQPFPQKPTRDIAQKRRQQSPGVRSRPQLSGSGRGGR